MNKIDIRKLQMLLLDAFKEVDRICKKYDIKYYMIGGTLIGAVRHKGFIPWDDDLDIGMMRCEYDRFLRYCPGQLTGKYFLQNYHTDVDFVPAVTRICINGTYIDDKYSRHLRFNKGAYIDIFPIDNAPDDEKLLKKHEDKIKRIDELMFYKTCTVYKKGPLFAKLIAKKIIKILLIPISFKYLQECRERVMKKYSQQETLRVCNTASKYNYKKETMNRSIYGEPVLLEFEDARYYAPQNWDMYLKQIYGSYMTLPPEGKRKPASDVYEL